MKLKKILLVTLLLCGITHVSAKNIITKGFIFGISSSFNDSTVYFTNIQEIDSVWADSKTHFLYSRENYSYQLRDYMREQGIATPTCITMFATDRKAVEKKYMYFKKKYQQNKHLTYIIKYIADSNFKFTAIPLEPKDK